MSEILYITGTNTGVGKTLVAGALTSAFREAGVRVLACKPLCSGGVEDVQILHAASAYNGTVEDLNAFAFEQPVSTYQAARDLGTVIQLEDIVRWIRKRQSGQELLIVEGAGGLLSPLGARFTNLELITALRCACIVVALNALGVVHHVLSVGRILKTEGISWSLVLNSTGECDASRSQNEGILREFDPALPDTIELPDLGLLNADWGGVEKKLKNLKKTIAWQRIGDSLSPSLRQRLTAKSKNTGNSVDI